MKISAFARRTWRQSLDFGGGVLWVLATMGLCWAAFGRPEWLA